MKITKGKIILLIIVAYFVIFAIINVNKEKDVNQFILDNVVYVKDGKVDPNNDGKLVLVSGKIESDNYVTFMELDEKFKSIKAKRIVEDYIKNDDGDYEWTERNEPLSDANGDYLKSLICDEKVSNVRIGEFELDEKGLSLIKDDSYYSKQPEVLGLITTGIDYSRDPYEENLKEGDIKLTYKYYDLDKHPNMSVLAVQKGNSFESYKYDKKEEVYQVFDSLVNDKETLTKELKANVKKTIRGKSLFIILIIGIGIFFIVDNRKGKKEEKKN